MVGTNENRREIQRKLRILQHATESGNVRKTCRYFGIGRASFYSATPPTLDSGALALNSAVNRLRVFILDRPFHRAIHLMPLSQKPAPPLIDFSSRRLWRARRWKPSSKKSETASLPTPYRARGDNDVRGTR